jgi:hypothetical protein
VFSIKTVVVFPPIEQLEAVRVGGEVVTAEQLPREVPPGEWAVVTDGVVHVGVRPLEPSQLGRPAPMVLERGPEGELWLTIPNYHGAPKRFWDYASLRGAFWRGNLRAGYVMEVVDRGEYPEAGAFLEHLGRSVVEDEVDQQKVRRVRFGGEGREVELRYDLFHSEPVGRRIDGQPYEPPSLTSPVAVQGEDGTLRLGDATLTTDPQPVWLMRLGGSRPHPDLLPGGEGTTSFPLPLGAASRPEGQGQAEGVAKTHSDGWAIVNPLDQPTRLRLETPRGTLSAESWGVGRIEWRGGEVVVDCLEQPVGLRVEES